MELVGISINHRTASVEVREKLHLSRDEILSFIPVLQKDFFKVGFILSTCNRTEIFGIPQTEFKDYSNLVDALNEIKSIDRISINNFERYFACSAVRHLFKVASGIDSMIVGDSQILSQIKDAFHVAEDMNFVDSVLKRLFDATIKVGKRSIKETAIGEGAVSVSYAAVQVIEKIFAVLPKKNALVIGAGETAELAAIHLRDKGLTNITITNRTIGKAESLAEKISGFVLPFDRFKEKLENFDVIVSATSAPEFILGVNDVKNMMKKRRGAPVVIMDIALPRDIDPKVAKYENVFYNDIDSLTKIVDENIERRKSEIPAVNNIIMEEMVGFYSWYNALNVIPTIKSFREYFESIREDELRKIKHKVSEEDYVKLEDMTRRMVGRLLHYPTITLRELAEKGDNTQEAANYSFILKDLFHLNGINKNDSEDKESESEG